VKQDMQVGTIDILPVFDGRALELRTDLVARGDGQGWDCPAHPEDSDGRLVLDLGGHLIRTRDRLLLVDAGVGTATAEHRTGGHLLDSLRALSVDPAQITDVIFTHLHFDHVGWATQQGRIVFPNATYRVHEDDWRHFVTSPDAAPGAVKKLSPLEAQLELFSSEVEIAPGIIARPAPGHTPGSTVFVVADSGQRAMLLGDVIHTVAELTDPEWQSLIDLDPAGARAVRQRFVDEAIAEGDIVAAAHFPGLGMGRLVTVEGRRSFSYV
jgi:glyoxylase-like metal-dependent hydrolase (beta-lactamase superfamily II)